MGVPGRQTMAASVGVGLHEELENWLLEGVEPASERLKKALDKFPPPKAEHVHIEKWLKTPLSIVEFKGRADVIDCRTGTPVLLDLKTTGNIRYALKPDQLRTDIQMNAYAYNIFEKYAPNADEITYTHIYVTTKGKELVKPVSITVKRSHVVDFWNNVIKPMADEMLLAANEEWLDAVDPSPAHCGAFGGCPYKNLCKDIKK